MELSLVLLFDASPSIYARMVLGS